MEPTASVPNVAMEITLTSSRQDGNETSKKMEMDKTLAKVAASFPNSRKRSHPEEHESP